MPAQAQGPGLERVPVLLVQERGLLAQEPEVGWVLALAKGVGRKESRRRSAPARR